jgi:ribosomal protein S18 acetylase RimI-like enzyme
MKIEIRKAGKSDLDKILELNKLQAEYHGRIDSYYRTDFRAIASFRKYISGLLKKRNARIIVAEIENEVIGYMIGAIERMKPHQFGPGRIGKISDAIVEEEYRRLGAARRMTIELINWFRKNNIKGIVLSVDARNIIGIKAWQKLGFEEIMKRMILKL